MRKLRKLRLELDPAGEIRHIWQDGLESSYFGLTRHDGVLLESSDHTSVHGVRLTDDTEDGLYLRLAKMGVDRLWTPGKRREREAVFSGFLGAAAIADHLSEELGKVLHGTERPRAIELKNKTTHPQLGILGRAAVNYAVAHFFDFSLGHDLDDDPSNDPRIVSGLLNALAVAGHDNYRGLRDGVASFERYNEGEAVLPERPADPDLRTATIYAAGTFGYPIEESLRTTSACS